jgi:hypothetical protein
VPRFDSIPIAIAISISNGASPNLGIVHNNISFDLEQIAYPSQLGNVDVSDIHKGGGWFMEPPGKGWTKGADKRLNNIV